MLYNLLHDVSVIHMFISNAHNILVQPQTLETQSERIAQNIFQHCLSDSEYAPYPKKPNISSHPVSAKTTSAACHPSQCHTLRESLLLRVLAKLIARGGKADKAASGARMVPRDKAWPLAEAAMAGNFDWEAYVHEYI